MAVAWFKTGAVKPKTESVSRRLPTGVAETVTASLAAYGARADDA
jgi:hypothetical protein